MVFNICLCIRCPPELGLSKDSPVKVQVVEEGSEPADFWTALGEMDRKAYDCMLQGGSFFCYALPRSFFNTANLKTEEATRLSFVRSC